jgi:putative transposase
LVERNFAAPAPNRLWVADITYISTWAGFLYLAVVLDAFSRKIVGWAMETHLRTELVLKALDMALGQRRAVGVIHHSDQGSQYTSLAFAKRCKEAGAKPSMGSVGESFFATLECELLERWRFKTQVEARLAVFDFIEGWYNPHRRHSALGYLSPIAYERVHRDRAEQTMRSSTALRTAWPPKNSAADAVHGAAVSIPEPMGFSSPASNRVKAGAEKLVSDQCQEDTFSAAEPTN